MSTTVDGLAAPCTLRTPPPIGSHSAAPSGRASGRKVLSKPQELAVGTFAGLATAAATQLIRGTSGGVALAPCLSQAFTTTGATIAGFLQMSSVRTGGGDPYNYGAWRTAGSNAAMAILVVDCLLAPPAGPGAVDPALTYSWPAMGLLAANAGLSGWAARTHLHNGSARVAGFTSAVTGVIIALWGASQPPMRQ